MPKRQSRKKNRQAKKTNNLSSIEKLERRQLLTGTPSADSHDFNIVLEGGGSTYTATPNSYSAPWTFNIDSAGNTVQGANKRGDWTSTLTGQTNTTHLHSNGVIKNINDFHTHLKNGSVAEVSDDLIGVFYFEPTDTSQPASLYRPTIEKAWVGSSDNLYSLLLLNQRFPAGTDSVLGTNTSFPISAKAIQGMARIVGFGFTGVPDLVPATYQVPTIAVINRNDTPFKAADGLEIGPIDKLDDFVPTLTRFFVQTNTQRPAGSEPLPLSVLEHLEHSYAEGFHSQKTPIEIFSDISGIIHLEDLIAAGLYPQDPPISPPPIPNPPGTTYTSPPQWDAHFNPPPIENRGDNYNTYQEACGVVDGYYLNNNTANITAIAQFFENFADHRIVELSGINPITESVAYESKINELAVGFRALMAMAFDAAPLWTSYGVGYSNAVNPMVGNKTSGENLQPQSFNQSFLEGFSGQEFQLDNILLPRTVLKVFETPQSAPALETIVPTSGRLLGNSYDTSSNPAPTGADNFATYGWYQLDVDVPLPQGDNSLTLQSTSTIPASEYFQSQYSISNAGTSAHLPQSSTSSDTLSAQGITTAQENDLLTRNSIVTFNGNQKIIGSLSGLIHSPDVLPKNFATYISLGGGVDLVNGSSFDDVIVGPGHGQPINPDFHGRLTVSAGSGDDVVAPGRGGSVVELGPGADHVVFGIDDLFGEATFYDFKHSDGDRILISEGIDTHWDAETPNTLLLKGNGGTKTLRLVASSDKFWHDDVLVINYPPVDSLTVATGYSAGGANGATGELNYVETHQFNVGTADISNWTLTISSAVTQGNATPKDLPDQIWVTVGDVQYGSMKHKDTGNHVIPLTQFDKMFTDEGLGKDKAYQISLTPYDSVTVTDRSFGNRQVEVFITRGPYTQPSANFEKTLVTSSLGQTFAPTDPVASGYSGPTTAFRKFKISDDSYVLAYVGGLADLFIDDAIYATRTTPSANVKGLQITVDNDFYPGGGLNQPSLSGRMALWGPFNATDIETVYHAATDSAPNGSWKYDLPAQLNKGINNGMPHGNFLGIKHLATDRPVVVNGNGRINGYKIVSDTRNNGSSQATPGWNDAVNGDLEDNPIYMINSDMFSASSVHQTTPNDDNDWAIDISGVTVAWPAYRGVGSVLIQDYNNVVSIDPLVASDAHAEFSLDFQLVDPNPLLPMPLRDSRFYLENSKVKVYDYKQVGGWVDRTDGPGISSWHTKFSNSFIHANDDSLKVQAPFYKSENNTIAQGNAGNAVGFAYGFINSSASGSVIDSTYVHRAIVKDSGNGFGLVAMRIIPNTDWLRYKKFAEVTVSNLFVPGFNDGTAELNQVETANKLLVGPSARSFAPPQPATPQNYEFSVGDINTQDGWNITPNPTAPSKFVIADTRQPSGVWPVQPTQDTQGSWTFSPTQIKLDNGSIVTVEQNPAPRPTKPTHQISLYKGGTVETIPRPKLHRSSKIYLNREGEIGPSPVRLVYSDLVRAASYGATAGEESFVVSNVANGSVEKKIGDSWVNVSEAPTSSNPFQLLALLQRRIISPSDEIRWVPSAEDSSKATAEAFSIFGWDSKDKIASDQPSIIDFETA